MGLAPQGACSLVVAGERSTGYSLRVRTAVFDSYRRFQEAVQCRGDTNVQRAQMSTVRCHVRRIRRVHMPRLRAPSAISQQPVDRREWPLRGYCADGTRKMGHRPLERVVCLLRDLTTDGATLRSSCIHTSTLSPRVALHQRRRRSRSADPRLGYTKPGIMHQIVSRMAARGRARSDERTSTCWCSQWFLLLWA